ncbi:uncharacterized protein LOC5517988 isoform X1 [Nematostella vectensis]|uniref:uncharacterized protein LOC5517988 isoform X1 n=1 Tax=Nematostella vectensis TaxID=45351 RepID=UPI0020774407|nr:uncharacterized protein LOC5517988 isoform X1 [Nematostella vectensis]XP_032218488.2 uncharacterized protein LOC5517988 isoform X1 [Nematostella vectensis]
MSTEEEFQKGQGSVDSEDSLEADFDIDSFIDDEFSSISAAMFEHEELEAAEKECPPEGESHLAKQLKSLRESFSDSSGGFKALKPSVRFQGVDEPGPSSVCCEACIKLRESKESTPAQETSAERENREVISVPDIRSSIVSDEIIVDLREDIGSCWKTLGACLGINNSKLMNIDADIPNSAEKGQKLLLAWKQQQGHGATVGCLEQALLRTKRKDIADFLAELAGLSTLEAQGIRSLNQPLNLNIRVSLTTDHENPETIQPVLLCEDILGRKYLVKEITDGDNWKVEKIVDDERVLERMITAARYSKKTKEQRRQESLKRVSAELSQLRKRIQKVTLSSDDSDCDISPREELPQQILSTKTKENNLSSADLSELLRTCEFQSDSWQRMYRVLIKLIGEVGPLDGNSRCLKQLSDFTNELRDQENKLFPKIEQLEQVQKQLDKDQLVRLASLQKWRQTQNQQVDGIEKLLTSLLEQGNIRLTRKQQKAQNRKSEPILSRLTPGKNGRRRSRTETSESRSAYLNSLSDVREGRQPVISSPICARQMQVMER